MVPQSTQKCDPGHVLPATLDEHDGDTFDGDESGGFVLTGGVAVRVLGRAEVDVIVRCGRARPAQDGRRGCCRA